MNDPLLCLIRPESWNVAHKDVKYDLIGKVGCFIAGGTYDDFASTSCYSELAFLGNIEGGNPERLEKHFKAIPHETGHVTILNAAADQILDMKFDPVEYDPNLCLVEYDRRFAKNISNLN